MGVSVIGFYTSIGLANNYTDFRVSIISARRLFSMMDQPPAVRERESAEAGAAAAGAGATAAASGVGAAATATATAAAVAEGSPSLHFRNVDLRVRLGRLRLEPRREGARQLFARHRGRVPCGARRPQRRGQINARQPAPAPLGRAVG